MLNIYLNTVFIAPDTMNRNDFPILTEQVYNRPLVYLDNAATTQKPQAMMDALQYAYSHFNANIHRGVHHLSQLATRHHEQARQTVADFLHAASPNEIIFTKGTTDSINMLAFSFGEAFIHEGDEIIISAVEHHSNIVPWQMLCERKGATLKVIPLRDDLSLDMEAYKQLLSDRTRLVAVAHISNVLGTLNPVEDIIRLAHKRDIPVLIDGAQSVAHIPVNVSALDTESLQPLRNYLSGFVSVSEQQAITQPRHLAAVKRALFHLKEARRTIELFTPDVAATDLQAAQEALSEITGDRADEKLLDRVFSQFCVGK